MGLMMCGLLMEVGKALVARLLADWEKGGALDTVDPWCWAL